MLTGQYQRSLDSKSRVTLPAILRKQFGELVQLIPRKDALYGYTPEAFEAWVNSLNLDPRSRNDAETLLRLNAMATTVEIDSAGRVALAFLLCISCSTESSLLSPHNSVKVLSMIHKLIFSNSSVIPLYSSGDTTLLL